MPLGTAPSTIANPAAVSGAIVQYPDGSTQIADVLGNFDASQSAWAAANINGVFSNPNLNPEVLAFAPGTQDLPADAYVSVCSSTTQSVTAAHDRRALSGTAAAAQDLMDVAVFPRGYAMFDSESACTMRPALIPSMSGSTAPL